MVATLSSEENLQECQSQKQDKIILEKLEEENLRLKAIFKLHSIKINDEEESRRRRTKVKEEEDGGRRSSESSQLSSSSSEATSPEVPQSKVRNDMNGHLVTYSHVTESGTFSVLCLFLIRSNSFSPGM